MKPNAPRLWLLVMGLAIVPGGHLPAALVQHVVHVSLDGLGGTYLQFYVTNAPEQFPNFARLVNEGAFTFNARCDFGASETIPNHITMFTGRPSLQPIGAPNTTHHGYINNFPFASDTIHNSGNLAVPYKASFFDVAHDFGLSTAFYAGKYKLAICDRSYDTSTGTADVTGDDNGLDKIDLGSVPPNFQNVGGEAGVSNQVSFVISNLSSATPTRYTFVHLAEPDLTGHTLVWGSLEWSNMVRVVDQQLGRILQTIDENPALSNDTALIVTSDHGGFDAGHSRPEFLLTYTIPFFLRAPGIPRGVDLHALFSNRADPGTNRTDYATVPQPIRNGDSGNIALHLLGLPPIPGSFIVPVFGVTNVTMNIAQATNGAPTIWWPESASAFALEFADSLNPATQWQPVTNGVLNNGGMLVFTDTNAGATNRFYRLRKL